MRIGLNATCFNDRPSGANQRFVGIYGALIRAHRDWEFLVYEPADCAVGGWFGDAPNVRAIATPMRSTSRLQRGLRGVTYWPARHKQDRLDLFEMFHLPLFRAANCPTIVTIHDARSTLAGAGIFRRALGRSVTRHALRAADLVITVSETMKHELLRIEPTASVVSIYNGIDAEAFANGEGGPVAGLPTDYLLSVGHLEERKNYPRLIEAMAQLRVRRPGLGLVIVGNDGGQLDRIRRDIDRLGLAGTVVLLNNISDRKLVELYRGAQAVVFPSLYEGFGIPVLEAMAARRPLALSNLPVFAELTQGKGAYFPADNVDAMAHAIDQLLDSPDRQRELIAYGDNRIHDFSFELLAEQVESAYRHALAKSNR